MLAFVSVIGRVCNFVQGIRTCLTRDRAKHLMATEKILKRIQVTLRYLF